MPKKQHTEEQIISALKQSKGGEKTADVCRKLGVSQVTFYIGKKQYAGMPDWACRRFANYATCGMHLRITLLLFVLDRRRVNDRCIHDCPRGDADAPCSPDNGSLRPASGRTVRALPENDGS